MDVAHVHLVRVTPPSSIADRRDHRPAHLRLPRRQAHGPIVLRVDHVDRHVHAWPAARGRLGPSWPRWLSRTNSASRSPACGSHPRPKYHRRPLSMKASATGVRDRRSTWLVSAVHWQGWRLSHSVQPLRLLHPSDWSASSSFSIVGRNLQDSAAVPVGADHGDQYPSPRHSEPSEHQHPVIEGRRLVYVIDLDDHVHCASSTRRVGRLHAHHVLVVIRRSLSAANAPSSNAIRVV